MNHRSMTHQVFSHIAAALFASNSLRFLAAMVAAGLLIAVWAGNSLASDPIAPAAVVTPPLSAEQPSPAEMARAAGVKLPSLPWHTANIWWELASETENFELLEQTVTIDRDVPSTMNLYIAPMGVAMISGMQCYGGIQTNINGWATKESRERVFRGKGAIFSRWSNDKKTPIGLDHVLTAGEDCLVESAGYEGEFASVRRPFEWTKGTYTYRIRKDKTEQIDGQPHTWFTCEVETKDCCQITVGSLRFEGETFKFWPRQSAFVEVYSTRQIPRSHIPAVEVTFGWPRINGQPVKLKRAHAYYPNQSTQASPDCAVVTAEGSHCVVKVGPIFVRDEANRRHELPIVPPAE